ncbi:SIR2 family protein [Agrococcus beijingensis]|uniref:SIR2 family protein n=1 Tax=Agrococcus beijingensis TaxID=3068634 RepID=UPI002740F67D|nr:SIR2 family protein [Agrococcus sp. REN33]
MAVSPDRPELSWIGLLTDGVQRIAERNAPRANLLRQELEMASSAEDLATVAAAVKRHLAADFPRWISQSLGDIEPVHTRLAKAIAGLDSPILTTNYDTLLETSLGRDSVSWANPTLMRDVVRNARKSIGHLHGVWSDSTSLVFSTEDYDALLRQDGAQDIQSSAFNMKTFLFVGVGAGVEDPNFSPMVEAFGRHFHSSDGAHFRLCRDSEVDSATELSVVADVGYGADHGDLAGFLESLAASVVPDRSSEIQARARDVLLDQLRDNSALWRDNEAILAGGLADLVVEPIFLPAPHDQFVNDSALDDSAGALSEPFEADELIDQGGILLVAGETSSGVTTALIWLLDRASDRLQHPPILVDKPHAAGHHPVKRVVDRSLKGWDAEGDSSSPVILGVDNLRREPARTYERALSDIQQLDAPLKVIGVQQEDALEIAAALQATDDGVEIRIAFLGRFSDREARAIALRIAPAKGEAIAQAAMEMVRTRNLPRTPVTITLVVELLAAGIAIEEGDTDSWVLSKYLDLLLDKHLPSSSPQTPMLIRNKRVAMEDIAAGFVEKRTDSASRELLFKRLEGLFARLGWNYDPGDLLDELIARHVLKRLPDGNISFQRSAYLELSAGMAARKNDALRQAMLQHPIEMASIVRSYVAMTRSDEAMLEVMERELDRIFNEKLTGRIFASVKQQPGRKELFADRGEPEDREQEDREFPREGLMYDASDDSDTPAFLQGHLDELSGGRLAMLVVDLASRVLRDSDEVPNQELKQRVLTKLLHCWAVFTDLYEADLRELPNLDETVARLHPKDDPTTEQIEDLKTALVSIVPAFLTLSGMRACLAAASLHLALEDAELDPGSTAELMRVLALYSSSSPRWTAALNGLDDQAARTFFGASFLASLARHTFMADEAVTDQQRDDIRAFLRRVVLLRYRFDGVRERNEALNRFEQRLRRDRLTRNRALAIEM